jgi:hypothetical protein
MDKRSLETEIHETVQQIASLFHRHNIEYGPLSEDYWTLPVDPSQEVIVLHQLGFYLQGLLSRYNLRVGEKSKYDHYLNKFTRIMDEHVEGLRWKS